METVKGKIRFIVYHNPKEISEININGESLHWGNIGEWGEVLREAHKSSRVVEVIYDGEKADVKIMKVIVI